MIGDICIQDTLLEYLSICWILTTRLEYTCRLLLLFYGLTSQDRKIKPVTVRIPGRGASNQAEYR